MLVQDPKGVNGPKHPLPDAVTILDPKENVIPGVTAGVQTSQVFAVATPAVASGQEQQA